MSRYAGLYFMGEFRRSGIWTLEHNIPALDVGLDILKPQGFIQQSKLFHLDLFVAADIDAAKHGNIGVHRSFFYSY